VPVLDKLLARQRRGGDPAARAATCERLAAVHPDPAERKARLHEAIEAWLAAGKGDRAATAADRLAAADPLDEETVWLASEVALARGDHAGAAELLGRALASWEAAGSGGAGDPRRAELWRRLGDARRGRATPAVPRSPTAVAVPPRGRRAGAPDLADWPPRARPAAVDHLRALVDADPRDARRCWRWRASWPRRRPHRPGEDARAMYELAEALGAPLADADERSGSFRRARWLRRGSTRRRHRG
jgi:tetratricopeptide (TPR) repeat protein